MPVSQAIDWVDQYVSLPGERRFGDSRVYVRQVTRQDRDLEQHRGSRTGEVHGLDVVVPLVIPVDIVVPATRAATLTQRFANERLQMPAVGWRTGERRTTASCAADFGPWKHG
jgi:hypothetical protein